VREFFMQYWGLMLTQGVTVGGLLVVLSRWSARLEKDLERNAEEIMKRMTREECAKVHAKCDRHLDDKFVELSKENSDKFGKLWQAYTELAGEFKETRGELTKAVSLLEDGLKEMRRANGNTRGN